MQLHGMDISLHFRNLCFQNNINDEQSELKKHLII